VRLAVLFDHPLAGVGGCPLAIGWAVCWAARRRVGMSARIATVVKSNRAVGRFRSGVSAGGSPAAQ
jgi:hypothetical protein